MGTPFSSSGLRAIGLGLALGLVTAPANAAPTPPTDTHWRLANAVGIQSIDPTITDLVVDSEGNLSGVAGCNQYRRELGDEGYGETIVTRKSCSEAQMKQEAAFLQALEQTRHWDHDGERLLLRDAEGRTLAMMLEPITRTYHFECQGKAVVFDVIRRGQIRLTVDDQTVLMQREESASGSRYRDEDGAMTFWGKGTDGRLTQGDETRECQQVPPPDAYPIND
ncbi:META domain-containing protein [Guyparkeria sp. SB14A]|uniref:META domain-containing protein n=1 Tax=Guyparkeria sp. SB14A TaxID=2571147 RepID=UPI0010AD7665|nr:META domain-containing protein [Guyparkeria sp. SB14A]TKA89099.1 META domain-containing protein [Guyparkeria sp. SB14A]